MTTNVELKVKVDAYALLDAIINGLPCLAQVEVKKAVPIHNWKGGDRMQRTVKEKRNCFQQRLPVEQRCANCQVVFYAKKSTTILEGGIPPALTEPRSQK